MSVANGGICITCRAATQYLAIFDVLPAMTSVQSDIDPARDLIRMDMSGLLG